MRRSEAEHTLATTPPLPKNIDPRTEEAIASLASDKLLEEVSHLPADERGPAATELARLRLRAAHTKRRKETNRVRERAQAQLTELGRR